MERLAVGPDGGNLLGFLAAVGALVTLDGIAPEKPPTIRWTSAKGGWRPIFHVNGTDSDEQIVDAIYGALQHETFPEFTDIGTDLTVKPVWFREVAREAVMSSAPSNRRLVDFLAAFACDLPVRNGQTVQDTAFRTMSGVGHQHFLKSMHDLAQRTTSSDISAALFSPWAYQDGGPTMRWDPVDDRRYALRADNPSGSKTAPIRTVRGANRLAIEALPLFAVMPRQSGAITTGFVSGGRKAMTTVRWPIWSVPCDATTLATLLAQAALAHDQLDRKALDALGVAEVFEARRQTVDKYRSFTPATALLGISHANAGATTL